MKAPENDTMVLPSLPGDTAIPQWSGSFPLPRPLYSPLSLSENKSPSPSPLLQTKGVKSVSDFYTVWEA